ncbi:MAG: regulatory protein RecX [Bacteroidales bacterium]|jgi:regulatory protein
MNEVVYSKISFLCSKKEMCFFDVLNYLRKYKNLTKEEKIEIANKLKEENFIDEQRFANAFVNDSYKYNKWGKLKIINELKSKNIPQDIIDNAINTIDPEIYESIKNNLAENKRNLISDDDQQKELKVKKYLYSKGFEV